MGAHLPCITPSKTGRFGPVCELLVAYPRVDHVAGVCVVRDAVDLVPFLCGHYLRMGFAHLAFVDDGSSDGTLETLARIAARTRRVSVRQVHNNIFRQQELATGAANALLATGYRVIVPFDADEFWLTSAQEFDQLSAGAPEALFQGRWVNFVQSRKCRAGGGLSLLRMTYRPPEEVAHERESIIAYSGSFVCFRVTKIAFKSNGQVQLDTGQHRILQGPSLVHGPPMDIFHLPLRSKAEIPKRALNYEPRRSPVRESEIVSWQSAFHRAAVMGGKDQFLWAANSFDEKGQLDIFGRPMALVRDLRLRYLLLKAAWHLLYRYRLVPFGFATRAHWARAVGAGR